VSAAAAEDEEDGDMAVVTRLLAAGASANVGCPLARAARLGLTDAIARLLAAGGYVNVVDRQGSTPLYMAALHDQSKAVAALLAAGAAPDGGETREGETPLLAAALWGCADSARLLLQAGASTHPPRVKESPLLFASQGGFADVIRLLLIPPLPSQRPTRTDERTALHICAQRGRTAAAMALLEAGVPAGVPVFHGQTAILAAAMGPFPRTLRVLLRAHMEAHGSASTRRTLELVDEDVGGTALHAAAYTGSLSCVRLLLAAGADPARHTVTASMTPASLEGVFAVPALTLPPWCFAFDAFKRVSADRPTPSADAADDANAEAAGARAEGDDSDADSVHAPDQPPAFAASAMLHALGGRVGRSDPAPPHATLSPMVLWRRTVRRTATAVVVLVVEAAWMRRRPAVVAASEPE
jgi:ankyrin repeat protein